MTLAEFTSQQATLRCRHCGGGLDLERNANNGGVRPVCVACGSKTPIAGTQWLSQHNNNADSRRPKLSPTELLEVWEANGNHCAFCGKPRWFCERVKIGLTVQHVHPVCLGGAAGPLIPFCARCQERSVAALKETRNILDEIASLDDIIKRIETKHPELRG